MTRPWSPATMASLQRAATRGSSASRSAEAALIISGDAPASGLGSASRSRPLSMTGRPSARPTKRWNRSRRFSQSEKPEADRSSIATRCQMLATFFGSRSLRRIARPRIWFAETKLPA